MVRKPERKLPVQQLTILAIARLSEPITLTSIFPYLPEMIESFGVPETDIAFWAGTASAMFSVSQCLTAVSWGRASDRFGRKYIVLLGLVNAMITSLIWGFSTSLPMAITARALSGAGSGNVGIIRTMVAEMCPWKELQPRAFSLMPLVYSIGSVLGPAFGGALSNPYRRKPSEGPDDPRGHGGLLWRYPYALPNIVSSVFFLIGITVGVLFLKETLDSKRGQPDYGLLLGQKLQGVVVRGVTRAKNIWRQARGAETEPLLRANRPYTPPKDEESSVPLAPTTKRESAPGYREVITRQTALNLVVYTLLAMHSTAFDQLLPVFMHHPRAGKNVDEIKLPLNFNRGFGLRSSRIGALFTVNGFVGIFYQFFLFPPLARRYGVLHCLRIVLSVLTVVYVFVPFATLVPNENGAQAALFGLWLVKSLCCIFAFPCSTILLTNTASSLRVLGTVNGIATSTGAVGRAIGPSVAGVVFSRGVRRNFIIAPFWLLSLVAACSAVVSAWLVEGEGFGGDDDDAADESDEDKLDGAEGDDEPVEEYDELDEEDEVPEGDFAPLLSRASTLSRGRERAYSFGSAGQRGSGWGYSMGGASPGGADWIGAWTGCGGGEASVDGCEEEEE
ncbi:MFS general substrate transporter [Trichodelitschia bisporula]|uniref:MFS general substrate transporter n=1 Tax=Trichodelitschia bisporula TaxID=703511 RepID=A0A6G1I7I4_9PEZI|nr:MFS general substrate transporter [Trichodelitschia bisporula]